MIRLSSCLCTLALLLAGCANDPPREPPNPLPSITSSASLARGWSGSSGESGAGHFEPLLLKDAVVVAGRTGVISKYDLASGKRQWRKELGLTLGTGISGDDERFYVSGKDGAVIAIDSANGDELWRNAASTEVLRPPSVGFDSVIVRSADGRLLALEPADGDERWSSTFTPPALTINGYSKPLLVNGGVLAGLDDGRLIAMALNNGRPIWESVISVPTGRSEVERLVDIDADIEVDDEAIYVVNYRGKVARIEPAKGQIIWATEMSSTAGLTLLPEAIAVVDENDAVRAVDKSSGKVLWTQEALKGRRLTAPVVFDGKLIVGDLEGYLHLLEIGTGDFVGRVRVGDGPIHAAPVASPAHLVVQNSDGSLRVFTATAH